MIPAEIYPAVHYICLQEGLALTCGVDEAGRGPLAGPVVAAAVILCPDFDVEGLDDSKRLTPVQREAQRQRIFNSACVWAIGVVEPDIIDKINILQASFMAMRRALAALSVRPEIVLVDGHLQIPRLEIEQRSIIGGDGIEPSISAASILAKTYRDELMCKYAEQYPEYGFEKHKGYATEEHLANLLRLGPCPIHRKSFYPVSTYFLDL
jgi:ribonuclease HII